MALAFKAGGISVRTVGPFDLGRLSRLHKSCFDESWSRTDLAHLLAMPGGFGLIARLYDGGLIGLDGLRGVGFSLCRTVNDEAELLSIGVAPNHRGKGVAAALLRSSAERCRQVGAHSMFLEVAVDNMPAQRLYEAYGFARVGLRPDYYHRAGGVRVAAYTMRCDLDQVVLSPGQRSDPLTTRIAS